MRIAVISDIHANLEALVQVLIDIDQQKADAIRNLGDIVGYGPSPDEAVELMRSRNIPSVMGNHELALASKKYFNRLNETTQKSLRITRKLLSEASLRYLEALPGKISWQNARFVHGCPPESATVYLFDPSSAMLRKLLTSFDEKICFIGHTHTLTLFSLNGDKICKEELTGGVTALAAGARYIINIGSVGQPRDGLNNMAKYVLWDSDAETIEVRFVPYDISVTAEKIIKLGFPDHNARRLW